MPESIESRLRTVNAEITPPSPAAIRRRGDRLRHRQQVLSAVGGVLLVALTAGPIAKLAIPDQPVSVSASRPSSAAEPGVLALEDLPRRDRLSAWEEAAPSGAALACVRGEVVENLGADNTVHRRYGAHLAGSPASGPYASEIRETVLEFTDEKLATVAQQSVASWVQDCQSRDLISRSRSEPQPVEGLDAAGFWELFLRSAENVCEECDAVRFDRQAVVRVKSSLILLSHSEIGGPLEPEGLEEYMQQLVTRAVTGAAGDGGVRWE